MAILIVALLASLSSLAAAVVIIITERRISNDLLMKLGGIERCEACEGHERDDLFSAGYAGSQAKRFIDIGDEDVAYRDAATAASHASEVLRHRAHGWGN